MSRPRNAEQIRTGALKTAIRKAKMGCHSCAQGYFELARKHGATEEEISRTITTAVDSSEPGINRRRLLQLAAALVAGATLDVHELLPHRAETSSYYWGTDSTTASMMGIPQNFYIGRFGYGTSGSTYFFNTRAARMAGKSGTYMYWGLEGPESAPSDITPYRWGKQQASAALDQRYHNPNAVYVGGYTIFADIEVGFGGWSARHSAHPANRQVVRGFLDGIAAASTRATPFHPGIYVNPDEWRSYVGKDFRPDKSFVLWITGCYACNSSICAPCDETCMTTLTTVEKLLPRVSSTILGGSKAVLWQYWLDPPCDCGDFDVAIQNPTSGFTPVRSQATYASVC
jgi:AhpD family alkylhydroperoxidase